MSSVNLNLIAIGVFSITFLSIVAPLVNISPSFPAGITALILGLGAFDTFLWQNQGSTMLSDIFASPEQRQRVIHHEAGHFLRPLAKVFCDIIEGFSFFLLATTILRQRSPISKILKNWQT